MRHKQDIYKKPKIPLSDILSSVFIASLCGLFVVFEGTSYLHKLPRLDQLIESVKVDLDGMEKEIKEVSAGALADTTATTAPLEPLDVKPAVKVVAATESNKSKEALDKIAFESAADKEKALIKIMKSNDDPHQIFGSSSLIEKILSENDPVKLQSLIADYAYFSAEDKSLILTKEIDANHPKTVEKLLDKGFALTTPYPRANQLIFSRKYDMVILLLTRGVIDPKAANKYGYTLLHEASAKGHAKLIRLLVSLGADINAQANDGASALHYPSHLGFKIAVSTLIALGIDVNMKATLKYPGLDWKGYTPLHVAASRGHHKIVKRLIKAGAKLDELDNTGMTALEIATQKRYDKVVALLKTAMSGTVSSEDANATDADNDDDDTNEEEEEN